MSSFVSLGDVAESINVVIEVEEGLLYLLPPLLLDLGKGKLGLHNRLFPLLLSNDLWFIGLRPVGLLQVVEELDGLRRVHEAEVAKALLLEAVRQGAVWMIVCLLDQEALRSPCDSSSVTL